MDLVVTRGRGTAPLQNGYDQQNNYSQQSGYEHNQQNGCSQRNGGSGLCSYSGQDLWGGYQGQRFNSTLYSEL